MSAKKILKSKAPFIKLLLQHKMGFGGLILIVFVLITAIFAYVIAPDNSPNANRQTIEIQSKPPGFRQTFFIGKSLPHENKSFIQKFFSGTPITNELIPIESYAINDQQQLVLQQRIDDDTTVSVVIPVSQIKKPIEKNFITKTYPLGTDVFGRDVLSRIIIGSRISLSVGLVAVIISLLIGVSLGAVAGYFGGKVDAVVLWLINTVWSIPTLLLVFAFAVTLGKGLLQIYIAIGCTLWVSIARVVRGQVKVVKEQDYITAARLMGLSNFTIITRHILPNIAGSIMVLAAGNFATAILIEAGLSFLGLGAPPPVPSWGLMLKENYALIITAQPVQALVAGVAIFILVMGFNLLGNALRDTLDTENK